MTPAKPSDTNDIRVGKMNFATHLMWLTESWLISWSVLFYYDRISNEVMDREKNKQGRIERERLVLRILYILVFLWFLSSVINSQQLCHLDLG